MPSTVAERKLTSKRYSTTAIQAVMTCGITPKTITCSGLAPVACSASIGPWSISSILSAKNLPSMPTPCSARARTPGNGPRPTAETNTRARISSLILRMTLSNCRVPAYTQRLRCRLRAARNARGMAKTIPSNVPHKAICKVSTAGCHKRGKMLRSGGIERARKSPICGTPLLNSVQLNCVPWALQCSSNTASSTQAPVTSQPRAVSGVLTIQR
ncbi:hypothetical protein D3C78_959430 [compost metagenome]